MLDAIMKDRDKYDPPRPCPLYWDLFTEIPVSGIDKVWKLIRVEVVVIGISLPLHVLGFLRQWCIVLNLVGKMPWLVSIPSNHAFWESLLTWESTVKFETSDSSFSNG